MLCIKKNKCFVLRKINFNPFRPVETCRNTFQSVQICPDPFPGLPPSPPSPSYPLPLFPFLFGGKGRGREGGKPPPPKPPGRGGGDEVPPPPPQDFKQQQQKTKFSHSFFSLLCNLPTLEVSLSVHCCCCSKLHKHLWRRRPLNKKQNSLWHTSIFIFIYIYYISPLNKYLIFSFSKKKFLLSVVDAR